VALSREIPRPHPARLAGVSTASAHLFDQLTRLMVTMFGRLNSIQVQTINDAGALAFDLIASFLTCWRRSVCPTVAGGRQHGPDRLQLLEPLTPSSEAESGNGPEARVYLQGLVELAKSVLKIVFIGLIAWSVVSGYLTEFPTLVHRDPGHLGFRAHVHLQDHLLCQPGPVGGAGHAYQRWQYEESTEDDETEVKDAQTDQGDPKVQAASARSSVGQPIGA
jgi:type III secretory pathway component EscU